jgi:glucose/mannose-6-phosphate isomerase
MNNWSALRARHDPSGMFERIRDLPEQIEDAAARFRSPGRALSATDASAVLLLGMGGSAIGGEVVSALLRGTSRLPVLISRGYTIPAWCGRSTLVVATSYSGNTEETLAAWEEARASGAILAAVTSGGELADRAAAESAPLVLVPGGFPPRAAIGYLTVSLLLLLEEAGVAPASGGAIGETARFLAARREAWGFAAGAGEGEPARLAALLEGSLPFLYHGGGESEPVAARWSGQLAENAKMLSHRAAFPEANHNEIVGWSAGAPMAR